MINRPEKLQEVKRVLQFVHAIIKVCVYVCAGTYGFDVSMAIMSGDWKMELAVKLPMAAATTNIV